MPLLTAPISSTAPLRSTSPGTTTFRWSSVAEYASIVAIAAILWSVHAMTGRWMMEILMDALPTIPGIG